MKCIDDALMQKYIDGETTPAETGLIGEHLGKCRRCSQKAVEQRRFIASLKDALGRVVSEDQPVPGFPFADYPVREKRTKLRWILAASVAASVAAVSFFIYHKSEPPAKNVMYLYQVDGEFDANKPVSEQAMQFEKVEFDARAE